MPPLEELDELLDELELLLLELDELELLLDELLLELLLLELLLLELLLEELELSSHPVPVTTGISAAPPVFVP